MLHVICLAIFVVDAIALELAQRVQRVRKHAPHGELRLLPNTVQELKKYTLADFVQDFGRPYKKNTENWKHREGIFKKNLQHLVHLRAHKTRTWTPGITQFMDYNGSEYSQLLGYKGRRSRGIHAVSTGRHASYEPVVNKHENITVPHMLDVGRIAGKKLTNFVRDQGQCGSCWAAAAIATLEGVAETYPEVLAAMNAKAKKNKKSNRNTFNPRHGVLHREYEELWWERWLRWCHRRIGL